jgi:hypothetical protein
MRSCQPCSRELVRLTLAPYAEQSRKAAGEQRCERLWENRSAERRRTPLTKFGRCSEVHAEADRNTICAALKQYAGQLLPG